MHAWRAARAATRSAGAMAAPEVVAGVAAMASCSCYDTASTAATTTTVAMVAAKSDGATPKAAEAMVTVSGSKTGGVAMTEIISGWIGPWIGSGPRSRLESD
jgi:hypothetical protein